MFRLEIEDNNRARFIVGLIGDGHERWMLRWQALVKDGKEHTNLADVARQTAVLAGEEHRTMLEEFQRQMEAEEQENGAAA